MSGLKSLIIVATILVIVAGIQARNIPDHNKQRAISFADRFNKFSHSYKAMTRWVIEIGHCADHDKHSNSTDLGKDEIPPPPPPESATGPGQISYINPRVQEINTSSA